MRKHDCILVFTKDTQMKDDTQTNEYDIRDSINNPIVIILE